MKYFKITGRFSFFAFFIVLLFTSSCENEKRDPPGNIPEVVSFSKDIEPTFEAQCASCHNGSTPPNLTTGKAYAELQNGNYINIDNPAESEIYEVIIGSGSMAGYSDDYQREIILKWIEQGAQDN